MAFHTFFIDIMNVIKDDIQVVVVRGLNAMNWEETNETFDSVNEGIEVMKAVFEKYMPDYYVNGSVTWTHLQSKESLSKFCFYGLAQYHVSIANTGKLNKFISNEEVSY